MHVNNRHASQSTPRAVEELAHSHFGEMQPDKTAYIPCSVHMDWYCWCRYTGQLSTSPNCPAPPPTLHPLPPGLPYTSSVSLTAGTPGRPGCGAMWPGALDISGCWRDLVHKINMALKGKYQCFSLVWVISLIAAHLYIINSQFPIASLSYLNLKQILLHPWPYKDPPICSTLPIYLF